MALTVTVGMSGGVDSSVAAALLLEKGYNVKGVTLDLLPDGNFDDSDAKRVAQKLGIEHETVNMKALFKEKVIDNFIEEYINARTPNPCIRCNKYIKFGALMDYALSKGSDYIATGHYAKIEDGAFGMCYLKKTEAKKDQSYVLYNLTQERLSRVLFPLYGFTKEQIRQKARDLGLDIADKGDSQEICFIPDNDYAGFIMRNSDYRPQEGDFVDVNGNVLGRHKGLIYYTVGQRKGLGATFGKPMFVLRLDKEKNQVILGESGSEYSRFVKADSINLITEPDLDEPVRCKAKVRYLSTPADCTAMTCHGGICLIFDEPQRAVTPGQSVVLYDGDTVIGGGKITYAGDKWDD